MKTWPVPGDQLVKRRDGCPLLLSRRFLFRSVLLTKCLEQAIKTLVPPVLLRCKKPENWSKVAEKQ